MASRAAHFASIIVVGLTFWAPAVATAQEVYRVPGPWVDDRARHFEWPTLRGKITVLTMAYGACRQVCSTSLRVMQDLQGLADKRGLAVNFVVVGLDGSQDAPQDWADFRASRKLTRANWHFVTGSPAGTRQLAGALGLRYWRYGEHTVHDFKIVTLSEQGQMLRSIAKFGDDAAALLP